MSLQISELTPLADGTSYILPNEMDNLYDLPTTHRIFKKFDLEPNFFLMRQETNLGSTSRLEFSCVYYNDYDRLDQETPYYESLLKEAVRGITDKKANNFIDPSVKDTIDERLLSFISNPRSYAVGGGVYQNRCVFYVLTNGARTEYYLCANIYK